MSEKPVCEACKGQGNTMLAGTIGCEVCGIAYEPNWTDGTLSVIRTSERGIAFGQKTGTPPLDEGQMIVRLGVGVVRQGDELKRLKAAIREIEETIGLGEIFSDPEHDIACHADTLPERYRKLAAALERIQAALAIAKPPVDNDLRW